MSLPFYLKYCPSLARAFTNCLTRKSVPLYVSTSFYYLTDKSRYSPQHFVALRRLCSQQSESLSVNINRNSDEVSELFKNIDYEKITGNDETLLKKFKVILLEVEVMRQDGSKVPTFLTTDKWIELLHAKTRSQRIKLLNFLFITEKKKLNERKKKEEKKKRLALKREEFEKELAENQHINYGFQGSTIFLRVYSTSIDKYFNQRVISNMRFSQKIVLDLSYDQFMTPKEASLCVKQLTSLLAFNRLSDDPFNVYFCMANPQSKVMEKLTKVIPTLYEPEYPVNITEKSYLDLFPKEKLVYLTPHCREELMTYSHDDVYIIGGMVDKVNCDPISLSIAKRQGLRMAKLPLDRHLDWFSGTKSLTVNQVFSILMDLKSTGDWDKALQHVPRRKLYQSGREQKLTRGPVMYRQKLSQIFK